MNKEKIIISSHSGFCFGVKRALGIAKDALGKKKQVYSLGPIIHNPQVVHEFSRKGLKIIKNLKNARNKNISVLIPSHGISPEELKNKKFCYIDTTCPLVGKVQRIVKELKNKGYFIVIVGNKNHPEVRGLKGIAGKNSCVLKNKEEAKRLNLKRKKVALISQTTASLLTFKEILAEMVKKKLKTFTNFNTVCKNTLDRQKEARSIAKK